MGSLQNLNIKMCTQLTEAALVRYLKVSIEKKSLKTVRVDIDLMTPAVESLLACL